MPRLCARPAAAASSSGRRPRAQVVGEALGMSLPHSALAPSGHPIWLDMAKRSGRAVLAMLTAGVRMSDILTEDSLHNAMVVHAAFGGSTNLILHFPRSLTPPDFAGQRSTTGRASTGRCRASSTALPNGPRNHPTVQVFLAGGVPEVMLHLRRAGLLKGNAPTVSGETLESMLDWWEQSERRATLRRRLEERDGVNPDDIIMDPDGARHRGLNCHGQVSQSAILRPEGSVIKSTSIDPVGGRRRWRVSQNRSRSNFYERTGGDRRNQRRRHSGRRHSCADLSRTHGLGHGRNLPAHLRAEAS